MAGRVLFAGRLYPMADVAALMTPLPPVNHPGHADQKSHGRKGGGTATQLTQTDFADGVEHRPGHGDPGRDIAQRLREKMAGRVAERWDVSREDFDQLATEVNYGKNPWEGQSFDQAKREFVEQQSKIWGSAPGTGASGLAIIQHVAAKHHADVQLNPHEQDLLSWASQRPGLHRAASSLGDAMYGATQKWFADRGITHVEAERWTHSPGKESQSLRTSWSLKDQPGFMQAEPGMTKVSASIPVERIFSIPATGYGMYEETELVVMPAMGRRTDALMTPLPLARTYKRDKDGKFSSGGGGVRGALSGHETAEQVSTAAKAEAKRITGRDVEFSLAGMDTQLAAEHAEGILRGLERYPNVPVRRVQFGGGDRMAEMAGMFAETSRNGGVITFTRDAQRKGPEAYRRDVARAKEDGYLTDGSPIGVALHEFGHAAANSYALNGVGRNAAKRYAAVEEGSQDFAEVAGRTISKRAAEDHFELAGEAFADVMVHGAKAAGMSKAVVAEFDAQVRTEDEAFAEAGG